MTDQELIKEAQSELNRLQSIASDNFDNDEADALDELIVRFKKYTESKHSWISLESEPPPLDTLVWLFIERTGHVLLGERSTYIEDGETKWSWSEASGIVWNYKGTIAADCEFDDLEPSHWHSLPSLPTTKGAQG